MNLSLIQYVILGISSFALTGLLTGPVRHLAIRIGAMDAPTLKRKTQLAPVPYLGGVSIALSITTITCVGVILSDSNSNTLKFVSYILVPAFLMASMGLLDDLKGLPPLPRLAIQTVAGALVAIALVSTNDLGFAFNNRALDIGVSILWIVGICNSINFFDNIDGGAAGTVAVATLGILIISYSRQQELVSALAIVTSGACVGFLLWNKSPAKIYMGDAGSLFLGIILAILTIRLDPGLAPNWKSLVIPPILLAIPILDTCVAVFSRISRGVSPLKGGQDHLSHRLVRKGIERKVAVFFLWSLSAVFGALGIIIYVWGERLGTELIFGTGALWLLLFVWFWKIPPED